MKKVAIVGLGWLGMPLAMSLAARGWQVTGSKTTLDGVEAARMSGIESYPLRLEPELVCEADDLDALLDVDALVITLPARRSGPGEDFYLQAMQELVDSALAYRIPRIIFTSSTSVYGDAQGVVKENTPRNPVTASLQQAPKGGHIYNICAPAHPARNVFYPQMTRLLGMAPPHFRDAPDNGKGKIIDGSRICNELGFEYQYPDPLVMPME